MGPANARGGRGTMYDIANSARALNSKGCPANDRSVSASCRLAHLSLILCLLEAYFLRSAMGVVSSLGIILRSFQGAARAIGWK